MRISTIVTIALVGSALATPVAAQQAPSRAPRGIAWVGCWVAVDGIASQGRVCVLPAPAGELRIINFDGGTSSESTLLLNGERTPVASGACTGWEKSRISGDGDRIIVDAQIRCGESPQQTTTTAFVITPAGYWLQVNGAGVAMVANARIRLYRPVEMYAEFPADIRTEVVRYAADAEAARVAMRDRTVSAKDLVELESMDVAGRVIDLVVAASYPKSFAIDADGATSSALVSAGGDANQRLWSNSPFYYSNGFPMLSAYDMQLLRNCSLFGMMSCSCGGSILGYSAFGNQGYRNGCYGNSFGSYGSYGSYGGGYGLPVVIRPVTPPAATGYQGGGRAVSGRGYTAGDGATGTRTAIPSSGGNSATTRSDGSSGSSTSSGSSGSSGASGSTERTAKPRIP